MTSVPSPDTTRLAPWLKSNVPGFSGFESIEKFSTGQSNPTYLVCARSGRYVLRRKPPGQLLKSAHAVDREYRIMQALADTAVPVPRMYTLCEDDNIFDTMFYIMSYIEGRIFWNPSLPELATSDRGQLYDEIIRVLAELHSVDHVAVGLEDFGRPGSYFDRQTGRWSKQYRASETEKIEAMEHLMTWLPAHSPADDGQNGLIHGDYRLDNMIFHGREHRILAVIDWEISTVGHPLADLAYFCMGLRITPGQHIQGLGGKDRRALGIPEEAQMLDRYCQLRGISGIDNWPYYIAFSLFRLSAILQGVYKRSLDGNASNERAAKMGGMVRPLAELAEHILSDENT